MNISPRTVRSSRRTTSAVVFSSATGPSLEDHRGVEDRVHPRIPRSSDTGDPRNRRRNRGEGQSPLRAIRRR